MRYLILGSEGQIGGHLQDYLRNKGHSVTEFDIEITSDHDLRKQNNKELHHALKYADFVFFLAFDVGGSRYLKKYQDTFEFYRNNMLIMANTFDKIRERGLPFIFTSTQMSKMDFSAYGKLKQIGEECTKNLDGLVVSLWNVYGVEKDPDSEKNHVISDFIEMAKQGEIRMLTNGEECRDLLHADDCCEALYTLSQEYDNVDRGRDLHIYCGKWTKIIDLANLISKYIPCKVTPSTDVDTVQKSMQIKTDDYIKKYWKPKINLEEGIKDILEKTQINERI